ncbi:MAG: hypothetical protein M0Z81_02845 [Deltaproteobacteria bacterium]|jgi:hypothetical protein|nr:hypothetical protein [Deltaproteobacteria bacterium]
MLSEAAASLTVEEPLYSEGKQVKLELLAKLDDLPKSQSLALSYLTLPGSDMPVSSVNIDKIGTTTLSKSGINPIFTRPTVVLKQKFFSLQMWEGIVTKITSDSFFAKLVDLYSGNPDEEAEFAIDEIDHGDIHLFEIGAVFHWNIGYHESKGGQRTKQSIIRFRRLPAWTKREIEDVRKRAAEIRDSLGWGEPKLSPSIE